VTAPAAELVRAVDLFAGPGGWEEGALELGSIDILGVEWEEAACETARAAGHKRLHADVAALVIADVVREHGPFLGLIASPPCTLFSAAGKGVGRLVLDVLARAISRVFAGDDFDEVYAEASEAVWPVAYEEALARNDRRKADKQRTAEQLAAETGVDTATCLLVLQPARWAVALGPEWCAFEQVPAVLPLWKVYARELRKLGYSAWAGVLNAADYGVPQTRERAILIARRRGVAQPPEPTHAKDAHGEDLFGPGREKWVSMAQALGWGMTARPYLTLTCSNNSGGPDKEKVGGSGARRTLYEEAASDRWVEPEYPEAMGDVRQANGAVRPVDEPSPTLTSSMDNGNFQWVMRNGNQANACERPLDEPAGTLFFGERSNDVRWVLNTGRDWKPGGTRDDAQKRELDEPAPTLGSPSSQWQWAEERPATTVLGDPRINAPHSGSRGESMNGAPPEWAQERPATTVQGDSRVWPPGHKVNTDDLRRDAGAAERYGDRAGSKSIRVTVQEAGILQSFRADYPWQGTQSRQFQQVGNAIPPRLAGHVLRAAVS